MKDRSVYHEKRIICITVNSTKRSLLIRSRSAPKRVLAHAILVYQSHEKFRGVEASINDQW